MSQVKGKEYSPCTRLYYDPWKRSNPPGEQRWEEFQGIKPRLSHRCDNLIISAGIFESCWPVIALIRPGFARSYQTPFRMWFHRGVRGSHESLEIRREISQRWTLLGILIPVRNIHVACYHGVTSRSKTFSAVPVGRNLVHPGVSCEGRL